MVQGLINSFGIIVMAAIVAAVKIDSFTYMPLQDFGNAFSIFIAQNYGAKQLKRIKQGIKSAFIITILFSVSELSTHGFLCLSAINHFFAAINRLGSLSYKLHDSRI